MGGADGTGGHQSIDALVQEGGRLRVQRDLAWELINAIPGVSCVKPQGALYMFPRLDPAVYPIQDDQEFFLEVLQETKVMLVQGTVSTGPSLTTSASCSCRMRQICARPSTGWQPSSRSTASAMARTSPRQCRQKRHSSLPRLKAA